MTSTSGENTKAPEISLLEISRVLINHKRVIIKIAAVFFLLGVVVAFTNPREYRVAVTLLPESNTPSTGGLINQIGSIAGLSLGNISKKQTLNPEVYPLILQSSPYLKNLMDKPFYFEDLGKEVSLFEFINEHARSGLVEKVFGAPFKLIKFFRGSSTTSPSASSSEYPTFSRDEMLVAEELSSRIFISVDIETSIISLTVKMQDPKVCAAICQFTIDYIQNYVVQYYTLREQRSLEFIQKNYSESEVKFKAAQKALANFRDQNSNVVSASVLSEEERLRAEYDIAFGIYNTLAQELEQGKIKVQEVTPVFNIIQPVYIPTKKSEPRRGFIIILWTIIGGLISLIYIAVINLIGYLSSNL